MAKSTVIQAEQELVSSFLLAFQIIVQQIATTVIIPAQCMQRHYSAAVGASNGLMQVLHHGNGPTRRFCQNKTLSAFLGLCFVLLSRG